MDIQWAGIDMAGDLTQSVGELAVWFAHRRSSPEVEIPDVLSALFLLAGEEASTRWLQEEACQAYLWRVDLPPGDRKRILKEASDWLFSGFFQIEGTSISGHVRGREGQRPTTSSKVELFLDAAEKMARDNGLRYSTIDCVLLTLAEDPRFLEMELIRASGVDLRVIKESILKPKPNSEQDNPKS
jgi:hypothetical protein